MLPDENALKEVAGAAAGTPIDVAVDFRLYLEPKPFGNFGVQRFPVMDDDNETSVLCKGAFDVAKDFLYLIEVASLSSL